MRKPLLIGKFALRIAGFLVLALPASAVAQTPLPPVSDKIAEAAKRGDIAATLALTEEDGGPRGQGGTTAVLNSARAGQLGVLRAMLDAGADPNRPGRQGGLPLLQAISARQKAAAKLLIERGANPNKEGLCGRPHCEKHPALFGAVDVGDAETLSALLAAGADVSWKDHECTQAANMNGDVKIFDLLKRAGGHEWSEHPAVRLKISGAAAAAVRERSRAAAPLAPAALGLTELVAAPAVPATREASATKCRMAILADESNRAAADLLLAKLAGIASLEIVERADLEKILGEQKLARDFSGDAAAAVKVGALLRADALVFIRTQQVGEARLVETRFVRVNPGLVLDTVYRPAPLAAPDAWAEQIAARIAPLAGRTIEREGVAFSILNLRSTMGGVESRLLEQKIATLLTDRLVHQPQFHVLERTALDRLARETDPANAPTFWTGSYLLDGSIDVAADASEAVTITLRLQPAGGGAARTLVHHGRAAQIPALLDEVVAGLARALGKSDAPPARDLAAEAAAYAREAAWAKACRMPLAAGRAAETAWSLGDRSAETARLRVEQASAAIDDQVKRIGDAAHRAVSPDDSIWAMRDLLNNPLRPADALSEEALVNLGAQTAGAWREVLAALPDGLDREAWLKTGLEVCHNALLALVLVDTAAARMRVAAPLRALKAELREAVEAGISASKGTPQLAEFCIFKARYASAFHDSSSEFAKSILALMPVHFPEDDVLNRSHVRSAVVRAAEYGFTKDFFIVDSRAGGASGRSFRLNLPLGMELASLDLLAAALCQASAVEDQFIGWSLRLRRNLYGFRDLAILDKMLALAWELRHVVAQDTRTLETYFALILPNPLWGTRESGGGKVPGAFVPRPAKLPPELLKLRREFFIALCQESDFLTDRVSLLLDPDLYDETQAKAVHQAIEDHLARVSGKPGLPADYAAKWRRPAGPDLAPAAPVAPVVKAAPTLPETTPLRIEKFWTPPVSGEFGLVPIVSLSRAIFTENAVWFFTEQTAQFDPKGSGAASIVSVDLRTFRETRIPLRDQPGTPSRFAYATNLYVTPTRIVVAYPGRYLALCERASGKWEYFPNIKPDGMFAVLDDNLFITVKEEQAVGVLRFDLTKKRRTCSPARTAIRPRARWTIRRFKSPGSLPTRPGNSWPGFL